MKIVIGYDGSSYANTAMDDLKNAGLPDSTEAAVLCAADVFNVFDVQGAVGENPSVMAEAAERWRAGVDTNISQAMKMAEAGADRLRKLFPNWKITATSVGDSPSWALIQRSEGSGDPARAAELIVVGAAGHSAMGRLVFGSVANQVLSNAGCSVRVGRKCERGADEPLRLMACVDGSVGSRAAVDRIVARNWPRNTECRVVAVIDARLSTAYPPAVPFVASTAEALAQNIVDDARAQLKKAGIEATSAVRAGGAVSNLLKEAELYKAHCIFVGASGLGRVARILLGSVSRSMAMHAACSVEVVRAKG